MTLLWAKKDFDRAPLVHGYVPGGRLLKGQLEIEDLARVDLPVPDEFDQLGQVVADGRESES